MKVAIMTDSNSGITQSEAKDLGIYILPMPFTINGKDYKEDINLTQEEFYKLLEDENTQIFTSQPSIAEVSAMWDDILKDYDQVVHIPMSSGLSGSCQTALMLSDDDKYKGKVFVCDTQRISVTQRSDALDALELAKQGKTGEEIRDILIENKMHASIYITVPTLEYLKRGGRVTPAAAALGGLLKLKPILSIRGEKLDKYDTTRTIKKAKKIMIESMIEDMKTFDLGDDARLFCVYSKDIGPMEEFKEEVQAAFPNNTIEIHPLSLSISCHTGPGSIALAATKRIV